MRVLSGLGQMPCDPGPVVLDALDQCGWVAVRRAAEDEGLVQIPDGEVGVVDAADADEVGVVGPRARVQHGLDTIRSRC
jgi:hypothetical protein